MSTQRPPEASTKKWILVADDEPTIRDLVEEILLDLGYGVLTAETGHEALQVLHEKRPDGFLLDMMMPDMNGWAVLEDCRSDASCDGIPIVVMSAVISPEEAERLGAQGCLTKPFDIDDLVATLRRLVGDVERPAHAASDSTIQGGSPQRSYVA